MPHLIAGWSSPVARQAHNLKVVSSNLAPATKENQGFREIESLLLYPKWDTGGTLKIKNANNQKLITIQKPSKIDFFRLLCPFSVPQSNLHIYLSC